MANGFVTKSCDMDIVAKSGLLKKGDVFQIENQYKRRSLIQWLKRSKKELKQFKVLEDYKGNNAAQEYKEI